jgi:hypothetical protein
MLEPASGFKSSVCSHTSSVATILGRLNVAVAFASESFSNAYAMGGATNSVYTSAILEVFDDLWLASPPANVKVLDFANRVGDKVRAAYASISPQTAFDGTGTEAAAASGSYDCRQQPIFSQKSTTVPIWLVFSMGVRPVQDSIQELVVRDVVTPAAERLDGHVRLIWIAMLHARKSSLWNFRHEQPATIAKLISVWYAVMFADLACSVWVAGSIEGGRF